ncbi:putative thioredoxin [Pectobacterium phage My1]|uniref:Putative thioredoxin n=1 Tax=Pectobacterium phage My1 TaxID=1204539 RepID=J9QGQ4_9CAUD|nr:putative thioredoxin [Pectobacterium phage My1]AFQ22195.1 putative thioredoxin [Pectobacterium phage My1]
MGSKKIILLSGSTCVPCKHFKPVFEEAVKCTDIPHQILVDDVETMQKYGIRTVPTVLLIDEDGDLHHILSGSGLKSEVLHHAFTDFEGWADETYYQ